MKTKIIIITIFTLSLFVSIKAFAVPTGSGVTAKKGTQTAAKSFVDDNYEDDFEDEFGDEGNLAPMPDPFESVNRLIFTFNDKLYFWVLKPAAKGYSFVVPEVGRVAVRNFFDNLAAPIRIINTALQFKFKESVSEVARFTVNTTFGLAGFRDVATATWKMPVYDEDFGQTLGYWGAGPGFFVNVPFFGPSSLRDGTGLIVDIYADPRTYLPPDKTIEKVGVYFFKGVNSTSLNIDFYDDIKAEALDPYTFIRDAYHQHREHLVAE